VSLAVIGTGQSTGGRQEPVFNYEIWNSVELTGIVGDDDQSKGSSMSGDQQVIRADGLALLFQHASDVAIVPVGVNPRGRTSMLLRIASTFSESLEESPFVVTRFTSFQAGTLYLGYCKYPTSCQVVAFMNLLATIKSLYAVNGFAAVLLYMPQVFKAWKDREHALSLSLVSFGGWCIGSLITALYAWLLVKDSIFTAVSLGNMVGSGAVFLIAVNSRLWPGREAP